MRRIPAILLWLCSCCCFQAMMGQVPPLDWVYTAGGTWIEWAECVAVDPAGNTYVTGRFSDTVDFEPGVGVTAYTVPTGQAGFYLVKLDPNGNFVWAYTIDAVSAWGYSVCIDDSGFVFVTGTFSGSGDFDFGPGNFTLSTTYPQQDMFVLKVDGNGSFQWAKQFNGVNDQLPYAITCAPDGTIAIAGVFGGVTDFDPGPATFNMDPLVGNAFLSRLDQNGDFLWAGQFSDPGQGTTFEGLEFDDNGNLYGLAFCGGGSDIDMGPGVFNLPPAPYGLAVLFKLSATMQFLWAKTFIPSFSANPMGIAVDPWGNVAICGTYSGTLDFDPGPGSQIGSTPFLVYNDFFVKLDSSGDFDWAFEQPDVILNPSTEDVAFDSTGALYRMGLIYGTHDFDPGPNVFNLSASMGTHLYFAKHDSAGQFIWAGEVGTTVANNLSPNGRCITVGPQGQVVWCAEMEMPADLDPTPSMIVYNGNMRQDIVVGAWVDQCLPAAGRIEVAACERLEVNGQVFDSTGVYQQTLVNALGCDSLLTIDVTIATLSATVQQSGNSLTASPAGATYQWLNCEQMQPIPGATAQTFALTVGGSFAVVVIQGPCTDTSACFGAVGVASRSDWSPQPIPNPNNGRFTLDIGDLATQASRLTVYNALGQSLRAYELEAPSPVQVDLGGLPAGCYLGSIQHGTGRVVIRILVE